jgi:hypothetical protein
VDFEQSSAPLGDSQTRSNLRAEIDARLSLWSTRGPHADFPVSGLHNVQKAKYFRHSAPTEVSFERRGIANLTG